MSEVVLLATFRSQPGQRDDLLDLLISSLAMFRENEPGLEIAFFHRSPTNEDQVIGYERYSSADAFAQHRANYAEISEYSAFRSQLDALLAAPTELQSLDFTGGFARELSTI